MKPKELSESVWRERALRDAVLAGDAEAWRTLYEGSFEGLFAYVRYRSRRDVQLTEDVVQDTWMVAVKQIRKFDPLQGRFQNWLRGIAENTLRNHQRRAKRAFSLKRLLWSRSAREAAEPADSMSGERLELAEQVTLALTELPSRYQAVIRAKYQENLPVAEIATEWGESPKAIESLLSRARSAFREAYGRWLGAS